MRGIRYGWKKLRARIGHGGGRRPGNEASVRVRPSRPFNYLRGRYDKLTSHIENHALGMLIKYGSICVRVCTAGAPVAPSSRVLVLE